MVGAADISYEFINAFASVESRRMDGRTDRQTDSVAYEPTV